MDVVEFVRISYALETTPQALIDEIGLRLVGANSQAAECAAALKLSTGKPKRPRATVARPPRASWHVLRPTALSAFCICSNSWVSGTEGKAEG